MIEQMQRLGTVFTVVVTMLMLSEIPSSPVPSRVPFPVSRFPIVYTAAFSRFSMMLVEWPGSSRAAGS